MVKRIFRLARRILVESEAVPRRMVVCSCELLKRRIFMMKTEKRWQDRLPLLLGALLLLTPLVFGIAMLSTHSWNAWLLGALVGVASVALASLWWLFPDQGVVGGMTVVLGFVLLIAPWALGESWLTANAWTLCLLGIILISSAGGLAVARGSRRAVQRDIVASQAALRYRRLGNPV
jgi:hypothetical protein